MSNQFYAHGIYPAPNSAGASANMRNELDLITTGFDKLPELTGNNGKAVHVSADGTKLEATNTLTGVNLTGGAINNSPIGQTSPHQGKFTNLVASGQVSLRKIVLSQSDVANFDGTRLIGLPEPQLTSEAATKSYVDNIAKIPGPVGPQGPIGLQGIKGDTGLTGSPGTTAVLKGTFGVSKSFYDLPVNGYFPANWDAPGNPPAPYQAQVGDALLYLGGYFEMTTEAGQEIITEGSEGYAVESTGQNHAWVYVGTDFDATGWAYCGSIIGPKGDKGDPGLPGENGRDGVPGADGADGAMGPPGVDGADGAPGETPYIFWDSANNRIGITVSGATTYTPSLIGPVGPQGAQGIQGPEGTVTGAVTTFNSRSGAVSLISSDVTNAIGFVPAENDGGNAYGTWNISILGNANTANSATTAATAALATNATNAVNATTAATCTGNAATATLAATATTAVNASTKAVGDASEAIATTGFVARDFAKIGGTNASGTWPISITGKAVIADTQVATDRSTYIATTAFVGNNFATVSGSNATGTWNIGISGNAATVTNGLYSTGSYTNPSWLVSIPGSKVSSAVANATSAASCTGNSATVTNGVYTTGSYADPVWITSISASKVVGAVASATTAATCSGNAATATTALSCSGNSETVTNGLYSTGTYTNPSWLISIPGSKVSSAVANATTAASCTGNAATVTNGVYTTNTYADPAWISSLSGSKISGSVANATNASLATNASYAVTAGSATTASSATSASSVPWTGITSKPTTLAGYGISVAWSDIGSKPTTLSGYGITDAASASSVVNLTGAQTISGAKTFSTYPISPAGYNLASNIGIAPSGSSIVFNIISATPFSFGQNGAAYATTGWYTTSDARIKDNIAPIQSGLSIITSLNPVRFSYKRDKKSSANHSGFVAQEVESIIPDAVSNSGMAEGAVKDIKSVSYSDIVPYLVKAIQELKTEIDALKPAQPSI